MGRTVATCVLKVKSTDITDEEQEVKEEPRWHLHCRLFILFPVLDHELCKDRDHIDSVHLT